MSEVSTCMKRFFGFSAHPSPDVDHRLHHLQQRLLHALAGDVARDGEVLDLRVSLSISSM